MLGALTKTVSDMLALLNQSLKLSAMFPALVFVLLNHYVAQKYNWPTDWSKMEFSQQAVFVLIAVILLGYTLNILNIPIIRLFEGYPLCMTWLGRGMIKCQTKRKTWLRSRSEYIGELLSDNLNLLVARDPELLNRLALEYSLHMDRLSKFFPEEDFRLIPTDLGNTIAAFEDYPKQRYGIDAVYLWPRMLPILTEEEYAVFVEKEKAGLDFLLNLSLLLSVFGLECVGFKVIFGLQISPWWPIGALLTAFWLYRSSIRGAYSWGETVKVAFDLYRYQLARKLGLQPLNWKGEDKERTQWKNISSFLRKGIPEENGERKDPDWWFVPAISKGPKCGNPVEGCL